MDSQGQLGIVVRGLFIQFALLESLPRTAETCAEGELLIGISEFAEQAAGFVGPLVGGVDDAQGGGGLRAARLDALEENALELAAVLRAVLVNAAAATVERRTGLSQVRRPECRMRVADGQPQGPQSLRIIAWLQREVGKNDAIAAQAAREAELALRCGR